MKIKAQAEKLANALYQCLRGSNVVFRMSHSPRGTGFDVYASWLGNSVTADNTPFIHLYDLSLDNVPDVLSALSKVTNSSIYMDMTATVKPRAKTVFMLSTKYARAYRISAELAHVLHESAIRDDQLTITYSRRIAEISFNDYIDVYQYTVIDDDVP